MATLLPQNLRDFCAQITPRKTWFGKTLPKKVLPEKVLPERILPEKILGGLSLALVPLLALMLGAIPERSAIQAENTNWQILAENFIEDSPALKAPRTRAGAYTYALAYAKDGNKAALAQDLQTIAAFQTFSKPHFETAASQAATLHCLAQAIYYEARSESLAGQLAVAQVVLNRSAHRAYPATVCGVVFEGYERVTGCQFSFTCDGSMAIAPRGKSWVRSKQVAAHAMFEMSDITIGRATHYHTTAVNPVWSNTLLRTANIGAHIFYRFPSRREKALLIDPA